MSSSTRLLVLGVVKLFQPVHGYEVRRELISWRAQEWASIQPGSIYNALKTLARDGLLEVASTDQVGGRPERTTYRLTTAGQEEFHTLLREEWWAVRPPVDPLMAAVSFLGEISRAEAIAALEHRTAQIHGMVRAVEFAIDNHDTRESPYHVREMMRLMNARVSAELAWSQQFIERLRRGEYATGDDPPWQPLSRSAPGRGARNDRLPGTPRAPGRSRRNTAERSAPGRADREPPAARAPRRARGEPARLERAPRRRSAWAPGDGAVRSPGAARNHDATPRTALQRTDRNRSDRSPPARSDDSRAARASRDGESRDRASARPVGDARRNRRLRSRGPRR